MTLNPSTSVNSRVHSPPIPDPAQPSGRPIPVDPDALLSLAETAYLLLMSRRTIEFRILRGWPELPHRKIGGRVRFLRRDVTQYIEGSARISTRQVRGNAA